MLVKYEVGEYDKCKTRCDIYTDLYIGSFSCKGCSFCKGVMKDYVDCKHPSMPAFQGIEIVESLGHS